MNTNTTFRSRNIMLPPLALYTANVFLLVTIITLYGNTISAQVEGGITCYTPESAPLSVPASCSDLDVFIPTETTPVLTVRIAFHIMQRGEQLPKGNFDENDPDDVTFLNNTFARLNDLYMTGQEQWCDCAFVETNQIRDTRIRFELYGIFYHRDNSGYVNGDGTYQDPYNFNNFATCEDDVLNVFFSNPPLNSASGYGPGAYIGMFNWYNEYLQGNANPWGTGNLLGHEVGHVLGLSHSFGGGLLADMCQSELTNGIGKFCAEPHIDCTCSNNMMSYSRLADYISPLQMATMHRTLTLNEARSKFLKLDLQPTPIVIDQPGVEWDYSRIVQSDVQILPGASLRITCRVVMANNARIIVKRGARLIVDGGVITSKGPTATDCNGDLITEFPRWQGIEVWGNTTVSTSPAMLSESFPLQLTDPGVVILKNNAIIEHASPGIFPQQRGTPWVEQLEHFGGLISVNNAEFRDCRKGVEYISYAPLRSSSRFISGKFTQTYLGTVLPFPIQTNFYGLSSWQVNDISFEDCQFINLTAGIYVLNADFTIEKSLFQLCQHGVYIGSSTPGLGLHTEIGEADFGNTFEFCEYPASVYAYDLAEIDDNIIRYSPLGIYVEGSSGTIIQDNELLSNTYNNNYPLMSTGIGLTQTGSGVRNVIRCNEWKVTTSPPPIELIRDGILVYGDNRTTLFFDNIFKCKYDVKLVNYNEGVTGPGILPDQNLGSVATPRSVYNEFTAYDTPLHSNEIHTPDPASPNGPLTQAFLYYHPQGICHDPGPPVILGSKYIPRRPIKGTCAQTPSFHFTNRLVANGPIAFGCGVTPRPIFIFNSECSSIPCLDALYPQIAQDESLLSGGDAAYLYSRVQGMPNASSTVNSLIANSPWLSKGLLQTILSSSMSEDNKLLVLAENVPLSDQILGEASQVLTAQGYADLVSWHEPGQFSALDSLQGSLITKTNQKNNLLRFIVDSLMTIDNYTKAEDLLMADGGQYARETRLGLYIYKGDLAGASSLLSHWPASGTPDVEFTTVNAMYLDYAINGDLPSSTDSAELMDIALSSPFQAARAKTLLGAFYGILFEPLLPETYEAFNAPFNPVQPTTGIELTTTEFEVHPNPADDNIQVFLDTQKSLTDPEELTIVTIYDTKGALQHTQYIRDAETRIDLSSFSKGVYMIAAYRGTHHLGVRRFLKQ